MYRHSLKIDADCFYAVIKLVQLSVANGYSLFKLEERIARVLTDSKYDKQFWM